MPVLIECFSCGKKLKVRSELAGKKVKCPGCGTALLVAENHDEDARSEKSRPAAVRERPPGKSARKEAGAPTGASEEVFPYWFFQWGDWTDLKKKKAFLALSDDSLWTAPLEGKAAKRAEAALQAGEHPADALGDAATSIAYANFTEVRMNKHRTNLIIDHQVGEGLASEDFAFVDKDSRDEVFAELRRRLEGWEFFREQFSIFKAAWEPLVSMAVIAVFFAAAAVLSIWFKNLDSNNNFVGMIRLLGPLGWGLTGMGVILALAVWMGMRMRTPPIMLYLRPGQPTDLPRRKRQKAKDSGVEEDDE